MKYTVALALYMMSGWAVLLLWSAAVLSLGGAVYYLIRRVGRFIQDALQISPARLLSIARQAAAERNERPKSLNNMEAIYRPRIAKDFPGLRLEALEAEAKRLLELSYEIYDKAILPDKGRLKTAQIGKYYERELQRFIARKQQLGDQAPRFENLKIHHCVLSDYNKQNGRCKISFQFAVEAMVSSNILTKPEKCQFRNSIGYHLIEDEEQFAELGGGEVPLSRHCPNCGAPLTTSGTMVCPYCHSTLQQLELKRWVALEIEAELWEKPWNDTAAE